MSHCRFLRVLVLTSRDRSHLEVNTAGERKQVIREMMGCSTGHFAGEGGGGREGGGGLLAGTGGGGGGGGRIEGLSVGAGRGVGGEGGGRQY